MTPDALFRLAVTLHKQGQLLQAEALYRKLLTIAPNSVDAWLNHGTALQGMGRFAEALVSYNEVFAHDPNHAVAWLNSGLTLSMMGRFKEALANFDSAVALAPDSADAWRGRAHALYALGRGDEALESLDRALEIAPGHFDTMYRRAAALHVGQRFDEALAELARILRIWPDNPEALALKGALLCEIRRVPEGMACYRRHAEVVFGSMPAGDINDPQPKKRHDAEQRDWMAAHGISVHGFHLEDGARIAGPAINPANSVHVERLWRESDPQIVVIDDLLTESALKGLRRYCWGSTMWRRPYPSGYLGAVPEQGFSCPLLAQIADELRDVFPTVIGTRGLGMIWGFKYDNHLAGIPIHADQAAVNVNFWIAPEEANRDPASGGLVIWDKKAPLDWDFSRYNGHEGAIRDFLAKASAKPLTIPHRPNRAVIFDSDLFHATDRIDFCEGYENRRINVTMLYGRRTFHGK